MAHSNGAQLSNKGGTIRLVNPEGTLIHAVSYSKADAVENRFVRFNTEPLTHTSAMIDIYNDNDELVGSITEADLKVLQDALEEESDEDRDYYITPETIDLIGDGRATEHLLKVLREALGSSDGVDIRWERR